MSLAYVATLDIKPALHKILFTLSQYHLLTTKLVVLAVGSSGSATTVMENLQTLEAKRYIYRFPLATIAGRSPLVCVLAEQGMKYLRDEVGVEIAFYRHPSEWKTASSSWLIHPLELNKFIIAANKLSQFDSRLSLPTWEHDYALKSTPLRTTEETGQTHIVIPDAMLHFSAVLPQSGEAKRRIIWVELERDTHRKKAFIDKLRGIYWVALNGVFESRYNHPLPRIAFVSTAGEDHVEWMRQQARNLIIEIKGQIKPDNIRNRMFHFGHIPSLQGEDIDVPNIFLQPSWFHPFTHERYSLLDI